MPLRRSKQKKALHRRKSKRWRKVLLAWLGITAILLLLSWRLNEYRGGYIEIPVGPVVDGIVNWLIDNMAPLFNSIKIGTATVLNNLERFLLWLPWWIVLTSITLIAWQVAGVRTSIWSLACVYFIRMLGLWDMSMETLALVATAVLISNGIGIPMGILASRSHRVESMMRPMLDAMQTMPAFVYLIPALMFFGIGRVPGVMATVIYALPPSVRLTNLGIRHVSYELVEAAHAFGSTQRQLLFKVQLPLALPSIMAGVNQTIMLSLSIVVLAAMIGAGGLGREVLMALGQVDIGRGFVAGFTIVLLAMVLDRITQALGMKGNIKREGTHDY